MWVRILKWPCSACLSGNGEVPRPGDEYFKENHSRDFACAAEAGALESEQRMRNNSCRSNGLKNTSTSIRVHGKISWRQKAIRFYVSAKNYKEGLMMQLRVKNCSFYHSFSVLKNKREPVSLPYFLHFRKCVSRVSNLHLANRSHFELAFCHLLSKTRPAEDLKCTF